MIVMVTCSAALMFLIPNFNELKMPCKPLKAIARPLGIAIAICLLLLISLLYKTRKLWIKSFFKGQLLQKITLKTHYMWILNIKAGQKCFKCMLQQNVVTPLNSEDDLQDQEVK